MTLSGKTQQSFRKSFIFYLTAMAGLAVYLILVLVLQNSRNSGLLKEPDPALRYFFYAGAVVVVFVIRRAYSALSRRAVQGHPNKALDRLQTASLWTALLCEIPALLGLVFFLLTGITRDFYFLLVLSLILFLMYFPKKIHWQSADRKIKAGQS
jgi:hypothetical protein